MVSNLSGLLLGQCCAVGKVFRVLARIFLGGW